MVGIGILLGLTLTVTPAKPEVKLGEAVELNVTVKNDGKDAESLPAIELDKRSVTLSIGEGGKQFVLQRKMDKAPETKSLAGGESWTGKVEWTPTRAGAYPIEANYAGKASAETKVKVDPAAGGETEVGILMETTKGPMTIRFFPEPAPNHVAWFAERVRTGFYDGLGFHRVIKTFMAQGGDPAGTGAGGPGYSIPSEFSNDPKYTHSFGRLSTARTMDPNSAGSQFFLCFDKAGFLDGQYTCLGEVTKDGWDTLRKIEEIGADRDPQKPKELVKITKATLVPLKAGG
jgi:cyclophilin family peptidyl-prolyl cis-trans isomerase